jgi:epoxyqueuosine reductase QueG
MMPTITIRLNNLPECCRRCLERCPECVLRAELWRQATWQLSRAIPPSPRYLVENRLESQSLGLAEPPPEKLRPIKETIMYRVQGARRSKKSRAG